MYQGNMWLLAVIHMGTGLQGNHQSTLNLSERHPQRACTLFATTLYALSVILFVPSSQWCMQELVGMFSADYVNFQLISPHGQEFPDPNVFLMVLLQLVTQINSFLSANRKQCATIWSLSGFTHEPLLSNIHPMKSCSLVLDPCLLVSTIDFHSLIEFFYQMTCDLTNQEIPKGCFSGLIPWLV